MAKAGVIILAHGSRGNLGALAVPEALNKITKGLHRLISQETEVIGAALQFNRPDLEEAAESLISREANPIVIAPYFLFPGRHITEHIPQAIERLRSAHPQVKFILTDNLGMDESFVELMARRITRACPSLAPQLAGNIPAEDIEHQSMKIVDGFLPPDLAGEERVVIKRIIHTTGDPRVVRLIKFSPSAISSAVSAIGKGAPIFTDVRMVLSGISRKLAESCGCALSCALDETNPEEDSVVTRAARAMYGLGDKLDGAVVAIGNAPTALLALLNMIDGQGIVPAIVIGMPVGFVQASESKAKLISYNIPYVTIEGTRGGSATAAATVNALLRLACNRQPAERTQECQNES
ncbi:MAG: precorrin-8X methylmutase [Chloroflexi bacterium]|nr:precorrin-8X methylmutase [Chloroflexota bacterium]